MRKTNKPVLEVARIVSRFRKIMIEAQKAEIRVLLCGTIPDPRRLVDAKLRLLDEALKDLDMGPGNNFVGFRGLMFNANGKIRKELFKRSNIHLSEEGAEVVGPRIRLMFDVMCPPLESDVVQPAQTTVPVVLDQPVVQAPPVVQQVSKSASSRFGNGLRSAKRGQRANAPEVVSSTIWLPSARDPKEERRGRHRQELD